MQVEIEVSSFRTEYFQSEENEKHMRLNIDLIDKCRDLAQTRATAYQQMLAC